MQRLPEILLKFVRGGALDRQAHPHAAGEGEELVGSQAFEEPSVAGEHDGEQDVGIELGGTQQAQLGENGRQHLRKPRGRPAGLGDEHDWRFSFCCARDGCRTRKTPPSLRFLGRKVYLAAMVVLIAIMREGATAARMRQPVRVGWRRPPHGRALAGVMVYLWRAVDAEGEVLDCSWSSRSATRTPR